MTDGRLSRETLDDAARRFEAAGYRATPQRLAVVAVLMAQRGQITAQALHAALRRIQPHLGLATVYRTLDLLVGCGLAQPFPQPNNDVRYAFCSARHHHHLVCTGCGYVEEMPGRTLQAMERDLERERHFAIAKHVLTSRGTCHVCAPARRGGGELLWGSPGPDRGRARARDQHPVEPQRGPPRVRVQ